MKVKGTFLLSLFLLLALSACAKTTTQPGVSAPPERAIPAEAAAFDPLSLTGLEEPKSVCYLDGNTARPITRSAVAIPFSKKSLSGIPLDERFAFRRGLLSAIEQKAYDQIYASLAVGIETIEFNHIVPENRIGDVWLAVYYDSPELFWLTCSYLYWSNDKEHVTKLQVKFNDLAADIPQYRSEIISAMKAALSAAKKLADEEEKVRFVHDYLVESIEYKQDATNSQNIYSSLVKKETVCTGYSKAFACLLHEMEIPAHVMTGYAGYGYHAWNLLAIDEDFYNMDVTWDDAESYISRSYYNVTDTDISKTHTRSDDVTGLPICTSTKANWFVKNDLIAKNTDDFIARVIQNGITGEGSIDIMLKLPNSTMYEQTMEMLQKRWFSTIVKPVAAKFSLDPYDYEFTRWNPSKKQLTIDIGIAPAS